MKKLIASIFVLLAISPLANAHHDRGYYKARVLNATPVYEYHRISQPREICRTYRGRHSHHDGDAVLLGSVLGGTIGHAAGNRRNKGLATIAGAIIGGTVAHELTKNHHRSPNYPRRHTSCVTRYQKTKKVRVLQGYEVTYRYKGRVYQTFTEEKPGKRMRIYY